MSKETNKKETKQISVSSYIGLFIILCVIIFGASTYGAMLQQNSSSYFGFNFIGAIVLYVSYVFIIAQDVVNVSCLPDKQNTSSTWISSIPVLIFPLIAITLVFFLPSFFRQPFVDLMGTELGTTIAVAVNVSGLSLSAHVMAYYNILKYGCVA